MNTMAVTSRVSTNSTSNKSTASTANPTSTKSTASTANPASTKSTASKETPTSTKSAVSSGNYKPSKSGASVAASLNFNDYKDQNHVIDHGSLSSSSRGEKRLTGASPEQHLLDTSTSSNTIDDSEQKHSPVSTTTSTHSTCDRVPPTPHRAEGSFDSALIESEVRRIVSERLHLVKYEPYSCKRLSQDLAAELMERLKNLQYVNYKIVVMVSLGNRAEAPGLQFGSRCLWNAKTDRLIYVKHTNGSVYAVILVYALHFS